jgi:3-oxoacyl-[acyl-carrier-protein] synthase II
VRRVVLTGLGSVTPCGNDLATTWDRIVRGQSGVGPITRFDASSWPVRIAGEVRGFDPTPVLEPKAARRVDRFTQFGLVAAHEAMLDAGFQDGVRLGERAGVYLGSGIGGVEEIATGSLGLRDEGFKALSPFFIPKSLTNLVNGHVAIRYGILGPSLCVSTACATGNHSIGEAWRLIRGGECDLILAGGAEAAITPVGIAGFMVMKALSRRNDDPATASRPFDRQRDGFVMGEGAGVVLLEELEHARARGARIYCEVVGYGNTNDAHHITAPPPGHEGAARCMAQALRSAGMRPEDVDYINAHGTSTPANDLEETHAIKAVFGEHARRLMVSSTKSMTGHLLGAAGGIEAVFTAKALHHGLVPPTATLEEADEGCDLDYVPGVARAAPLRAAVSNAFGFGGTNASLVFRAYAD